MNTVNKPRAKVAANAALAAECDALKEGIRTFRTFLKNHQFEARDETGRARLCIAAKDVALLLDTMEADAEDAADRRQPARKALPVDAPAQHASAAA